MIMRNDSFYMDVVFYQGSAFDAELRQIIEK